MFDTSPYRIVVHHNSPLINITSFFYSEPSHVEGLTGRLSDIGPDELASTVKDLLTTVGHNSSKYRVDFCATAFDRMFMDLYSKIREHCISYSFRPDYADSPESINDWTTENFLDFFADLKSLSQPLTINIAKYVKLSKRGKDKPFKGEVLLTVYPFDKLAEYDINEYLNSLVSNYAEYKGTTLTQEQLAIITGQLKSAEYIGIDSFTEDSRLSDILFKTSKYLDLFKGI